MRHSLLPIFFIAILALSCTPASQVAQRKPHEVPTYRNDSEKTVDNDKILETPLPVLSGEAAHSALSTADTVMQTKPPSSENRPPKNLDVLWQQFAQRRSGEEVRSKPESDTQTPLIPVTNEEAFGAQKASLSQPAVTTRGNVVAVVISGDKALFYGQSENMDMDETLNVIKAGEYISMNLEDQPELMHVVKTEGFAFQPTPAVKEEFFEEEPEEESFENPNDLLLSLMEQRVSASEDLSEIPPDHPAEPASYEVTALSVMGAGSVVLDEEKLARWEQAIASRRRGTSSNTAIPAWILQGLEWLTNAPSEEPVRSQTIMPLYRHMEASGYFSDVNVNSMTPEQVVAKLRLFVNEMKTEKKNG